MMRATAAERQLLVRTRWLAENPAELAGTAAN
jgi:hypothetical protein